MMINLMLLMKGRRGTKKRPSHTIPDMAMIRTCGMKNASLHFVPNSLFWSGDREREMKKHFRNILFMFILELKFKHNENGSLLGHYYSVFHTRKGLIFDFTIFQFSPWLLARCNTFSATLNSPYSGCKYHINISWQISNDDVVFVLKAFFIELWKMKALTNFVSKFQHQKLFRYRTPNPRKKSMTKMDPIVITMSMITMFVISWSYNIF